MNNAANVTMEGAKIKIPNGSIWNATNSELSGTIDAIYILEGNIENFANWSANVTEYCASGSGSIPSTYLPANESCNTICLLYTSPSPRDQRGSRMPSSA